MLDNTDNNIEKKLQELLTNASKDPSDTFGLPKNYFEDLPGKVMDNITSIADFQSSSTVNPFAIPEDYFEKLPSNISERIITNANSGSVSVFIRILQPRYFIPIAAVIVLALGFIFYQNQKNSHSEKYFSMEDLKNSSYFDSFDEDLLIEMIPLPDQSTSADESIQYLIDHQIEISQIENELWKQ